MQDEQGNLFIPNILGGFEEEEQQQPQVVYFTQGDEGETQGVQFVEYVDAQGEFFNENVTVEDNSLERYVKERLYGAFHFLMLVDVIEMSNVT